MPGTARIGPMLIKGLLGAITTRQAPATFSGSPGGSRLCSTLR